MLLDRLSGLQSFLQILLELVVVGDRMLFLQEAGFEPKAVRLFDEQVRYFLFGNKTLKLSSLLNVSLSKATALDNTFRKQSKNNSTKVQLTYILLNKMQKKNLLSVNILLNYFSDFATRNSAYLSQVTFTPVIKTIKKYFKESC
jgi:hypothetical protein